MSLTQANRPEKMAYFDNMVSEIFGARIREMCGKEGHSGGKKSSYDFEV